MEIALILEIYLPDKLNYSNIFFLYVYNRIIDWAVTREITDSLNIFDWLLWGIINCTREEGPCLISGS